MCRILPGAKELTIIAGPCVVESRQLLQDVAGTMVSICAEFQLPYIFKASYRKANRTSGDSFTGLGDLQALEYLASVRENFGVPVISDVHEVHEVEMAAHYLDALQIPAFLCRQTELLQAAGRSGKAVNIKKGQFAAPEDMEKAAQKVRDTGNSNVWLCERGTTFGYHDLVVDMRSLVIMRRSGCPIVFDATHSVQKPSVGATSGGVPEFIPPLTRAALAVGVDAIFFETHPDPTKALSDAATQLKLSSARAFVEQALIIHHARLKSEGIA